MARYKISNKNNLTIIKRTGFKSVTINDSERLVFEQKFLPGLFHFTIEGKKKMTAADYLRGHKIEKGTILGG